MVAYVLELNESEFSELRQTSERSLRLKEHLAESHRLTSIQRPHLTYTLLLLPSAFLLYFSSSPFLLSKWVSNYSEAKL